MYLANIDYYKDNVKKRILMFVIDDEGDSYIGLRSDKLTDYDIRVIKSNEHMVLKPNWLKSNVPSFNRAFRRISKSNCKIRSRHGIDG